MVRQHTPEELAEAKRILKESEPLFEKRKVREQAEREKWASEIAMLERRVRDEYVEVDLGNGDTIALRTCLSEGEGKRIAKLEKDRAGLDLSAPESAEQADEIAFEILEIVTANPIITKSWLKKNRDKFALNDMLTVTFGWYDQQIARFRRIKDLKSFRPEQTGPELRGVPALHESDRSEGMGRAP